ncbi:MAG: SGNH/GDSL hydrolase family protein [Magnetococcus sp. DMHC-8]
MPVDWHPASTRSGARRRRALILLTGLWWCLLLVTPGQANEAADRLLAEGNRLYDHQDYEAAIPLFTQAVAQWEAQGPSMALAIARHQLGFALLGARRFLDAVPLFEENQRFHLMQGRTADAVHYVIYSANARQQQGDNMAALADLRRARAMATDATQQAQVEGEMIRLHLDMDQPAAVRGLVTAAFCHHSPAIYDQFIRPVLNPFHILPGSCDTAWWGLVLVGGVLLLAALLVWRWPVNGALLLSSLLLAGLMGEGLLRWWQPPLPVRHFLFAPDSISRFVPAQGVMPGVSYQESRFTVNEVGLRGDPFPREDGVFKVVVVGGSTTESLFLDDADVWTRRLQTHLATRRRVWVGNSGKSGLNSFGHLLQVHHHLREMQPDLLLVMAGINDLNLCISGGMAALRDNARLASGPGYLTAYRRHVFARIDWAEQGEWQWQRLWQRFATRGSPTAPQPDQPHLVQDEAGLFYEEQRRRRQRAEQVESEPEVTECLTVFAANLTRMARMAREAQVPLLLLTQGSLYKEQMPPAEEELLWFGAVGVNFFGPQPAPRYYTARVMARLLARYNDATLAVCQAERIACFDVDKNLPRDTTTYYDDVHLNVHGAHALGDRLAAFLASQHLGTRPGASR